MNPTERYIKMCEKAEEIQKEWEPKTGDWAIDVWHRNPVAVIEELDSKNLLVSQIGGGQYENERDKFIWLPTQDQLQEMCNPPLDVLLMEFWQWIPKYEVGVKYTSMNELWLAFVMWEKYHKVWDDEKEEWRRTK